ncbi:alanine--glyoxylate aminotransferase family protein [Kocuria sp. JC486]|uniref:pyridoxal-phosphate-dependent aminotransferase family protein n=1 Tax=Kocuria sp. JC486 TaxID=1970736 RepID=UPI00142293D6|nr:alanine--glyoxylate aminotransferase family protein [Kocuria sp. JC486]NHU86046.1 alanine--glyoxylate aminotransferase family protein [Kocuria sp. JC486]
MGPGPINADPRVTRAMSAALVGQYDPWMTDSMNQTMSLYREVFRTANEWTFLVDGTSRAGIEAALVSLVEPGETVLVPVFGRFGLLLKEIGERIGARVVTVEVEWGQVFDAARLEDAIRAEKPAVVAVVQGDTSTTMNQPLEELGAICDRHGALLYVDVTASLGGNRLETDAWGLDAVTAGLQKCLAGPSGSAPITLSEAAVAKIRSRRHVEAGIADGSSAGPGPVIRSNYFDLAQIMDYWGPQRLNHHTEATTMLYGARECARLLVEEGMDAAVARHALHGQAMAAGLRAMGLELFGDQQHRMNNVIAVKIPDGIDGDAVRSGLLSDYGVEIGTSFGPLHGVVWRIGVMGYNARREAVLTTLSVLESALRTAGVPVVSGGGTGAALEFYQEAA